MWYSVPRLLSVGGPECGDKGYVFGVKDQSSNILHTDRQQSGDIIPHAVNHSLALLRMGKELPVTC